MELEIIEMNLFSVVHIFNLEWGKIELYEFFLKV